MSIDLVHTFLSGASFDAKDAVAISEINKVGGMGLPSFFLGEEEAWLKGDQHRVWMRWFLDRMASPYQFLNPSGAVRTDVLAFVANRIRHMFPTAPGYARNDLADSATNHIFAEVKRLENAGKRDTASVATRKLLVAQSPRCYICGYEFSPEAIAKFSKQKGVSAPVLPTHVDVFMPRGLIDRDLRIEIEHVVPVASGGSGQTNLQLACGWCNRWKSSHTSIYDVSTKTLTATSPFQIGAYTQFELPHPFWVVRALTLRGKCSHPSGCTNTPLNKDFVVAPVDLEGSPNPSNLKVYCGDHDPLILSRMKKRPDAAKIWRKQTVP